MGSKGWLVGIVLAAGIGLAVVAAAPLLRCPDCGDAPAKKQGHLIGCLRCGDGGRMTPLNGWSRGDLDRDLAAAVRTGNTGSSEFLSAIGGLAGRNGLPASGLLGLGGVPNRFESGLAGFVQDGRQSRVVVVLACSGAVRGQTDGRVLLFDRRGRLLDQLGVYGVKADWMGAAFTDASPPEGRHVRMNAVELRGTSMISVFPEFVLVQGGAVGVVYDVVTDRPADWAQKGFCRVGVRDGRLVVLSPAAVRGWP